MIEEMMPRLLPSSAAGDESTPAASQVRVRRRLLFLLPFAPRLDAMHGGGRAMAQLLSTLARRHQIALLYLRAPEEPPLDPTLEAQCVLAQEVSRRGIPRTRQELWLRRVRLITSFLRLRPLWATDWASDQFAARVREIAHSWRPDLVQIEYHIMAQYASALGDCSAPCVLVEHEPGVRAAPYLPSSLGRMAQLANHIDGWVWKWFEPAMLRRVQAVVVFTERDRQAIDGLGEQTPAVKIPLGTTLPAKPLNPLGCQPPSLLFFGSFIHPPNADAAMRLARGIFPALRGRYPHLKLYIVGDQPSPELNEIAGGSVVVTGRVPDVSPYLDRATVCVMPLRQGGGMRVKVMEALAAGKATIASLLAVEGLDVVDGEQIVLAETDEGFCIAIAQLLDDPARRASLARSARKWACANLGWEKPLAAYEALYSRLVGCPAE